MSQARDLINNFKLVSVDDANIHIYMNLAQSYEAEFSNLTHKVPNELGIYELDTMPIDPYKGYLLYKNKTPIGFCVVGLENKVNDIAEFYVVPSMRKNKFGYILASTVFDMYPGDWQVRQIEGADGAKAFWRKVINQYTKGKYTEAVVTDPGWGVVTRQQFLSNARKNTQVNSSNPDGLPLHGIFFSLNIKANSAVEAKALNVTLSNDGE